MLREKGVLISDEKALATFINLPLRYGCFPDDLKAAEVSPIFKKKWRIRGGKLQASGYFASHIKRLWKDHVYSNWKFYER